MNRAKALEEKFSLKNISCYIVTDISDIFYISGFTGSTAYIVFDSGGFTLVTDGRYENQVKNELHEMFSVEIVTSYIEYFREFAERKKTVTVDKSCPLDFYLKLGEYTEICVDNDSIVPKMRRIKDNEEIQEIKKSYEIAGNAFMNMLENIDYNMTESLWAAHLEYRMKALGADSTSFDTIVASGYRGSLPHGKASCKEVKRGEPVIVDYGCKRGYCSDITRLISDSDNSMVEDVAGIVYSALKKATESVKPGIRCCDVDFTARNYIESKGYGKYFTHGLGHGVGIDVHESPAFKKTDETLLEPGMVLTIEPGIYLPDNFGVRLEDTILVSETGCEILSSVLDRYVYNIET